MSNHIRSFPKLRLIALIAFILGGGICTDANAAKSGAGAPTGTTSGTPSPTAQNPSGGTPNQTPSPQAASSPGLLNAENDLTSFYATAYSIKALVGDMLKCHPKLKGAFVFSLPVSPQQALDLAAMQQRMQALHQKFINAEKKVVRVQPGPASPAAAGIPGITSEIGDIAQAINAIMNVIGAFKSTRSSEGETITEDQDSLNRMLIAQLLAQDCSVYDYSNNLVSEDDPALADSKLKILSAFATLMSDDSDLKTLSAQNPTSPDAANLKQLITDADTLISTLNGGTTVDQLPGPSQPAPPPGPAPAPAPAGQAGTAQPPVPNNNPTPVQNGSLLANLADAEYLLDTLEANSPNGVELISCKSIAASTSQTNLVRFVGEDENVISATSVMDIQVLNTKTNRMDFGHYVAVRGYELYAFSKARDETRLPLCDHTTASLPPPRTVRLSNP